VNNSKPLANPMALLKNLKIKKKNEMGNSSRKRQKENRAHA
jgi:hypothetical protein